MQQAHIVDENTIIEFSESDSSLCIHTKNYRLRYHQSRLEISTCDIKFTVYTSKDITDIKHHMTIGKYSVHVNIYDDGYSKCMIVTGNDQCDINPFIEHIYDIFGIKPSLIRNGFNVADYVVDEHIKTYYVNIIRDLINHDPIYKTVEEIEYGLKTNRFTHELNQYKQILEERYNIYTFLPVTG